MADVLRPQYARIDRVGNTGLGNERAWYNPGGKVIMRSVLS